MFLGFTTRKQHRAFSCLFEKSYKAFLNSVPYVITVIKYKSVNIKSSPRQSLNSACVIVYCLGQGSNLPIIYFSFGFLRGSILLEILFSRHIIISRRKSLFNIMIIFIKNIFSWGWFDIYIYLVKTVVEIDVEQKII